MKSFRSSLLIFLLACCVAEFLPGITWAHFIASDQGIKVVSHIVPNDDPVIGQPATFFFEITDKQRKFDAAMCDCQVRIIRDGRELFAQALFKDHQNVLGSPAFVFTFPERAIYTVIVSGSPTHPEAFTSFLTEFDIRVDEQERNDMHLHGLISHSTHDILVMILVFGAVAYLFAKEYDVF